MLNQIDNLKVESIVCKTSKPYGEIRSRKMHTFNIRVSGCVEYYFDDKTILVNEGEVIFLPKGCTYNYRVLSEESACTIINMQGDFGQCEPARYSIDNFYYINTFKNNIADLWNFGSVADRYACLSHIYSLLSYVSNYEILNYSDKKKPHIIEPAINYLKKHIYDTSLKIDELHQLCGVSDTYFRKIFTSIFGMSPKKYVMEKRMSHAKLIIDIGEFNTVKQLALSVGYMDSLYFSKVFKKYHGVSPSDLNNMEKNT